MLSPERAELGVLSMLQTPQDLRAVIQEGVTGASFLIYGEVFDHYRTYLQQHGSLPQQADVLDAYSQLEMEFYADGELGYYLVELQQNHLLRQAVAAVNVSFGLEGDRLEADPDEAIRKLTEELRRLQRVDSRHVAWLDRDAMDRLDWLLDKAGAQEQGKVLGIPTGLRCFDAVVQGWGAGEAVMVIASKGVGKTWLALFFGVVARSHGFKVLFFSPEMSLQECALRFDVLMAYQLGERDILTHAGLSSGTQNVAVYRDWLTKLTRRDRFIVVDSPGVGGFTTSNILALMDEHRPDMAILDGIHLVGSDTGAPGWERIKQTADALKATALHMGCTVLWTSQVDREGMRNPTEPAQTGASAAYGKAAVEAANRLITLGRYEHDERHRTFRVPNNRSGPEYHTRQHLLFDVNVGAIEQVDPPDTARFEGVF